MMRRPVAAVLLALCLAGTAQVHRRDPLTSAEADALREVSMEPDKKLPLYVKYARARLASIEQLRADPHSVADRGQNIHDLLQDFKVIMDEMDRNLDSFANQKLEFRKALKHIVQADSEFRVALGKLKESAKDPANAASAKEYEFAVLDAADAVDGNLDNAKDLLQEQEKAAAEAKAKAKEKKK
ncbi:MAG TPA: hypothetical protein VMT05_08970 [Terriglobales bacterium]|jgi:hypothetical protein|nr:hypothetical protein [Terriglobales bacterium]